MLVVNSQSRDRLGATKPARPVANCLSNQAGGPLEQNADDLKRRICSISLLPHLFCRKPVPTFRRDALGESDIVRTAAIERELMPDSNHERTFLLPKNAYSRQTAQDDLPKRLLSGIILLVIGGGGLYAGGWPFLLLLAATCFGAGLEFNRMVKLRQPMALAALCALCAGLGMILQRLYVSGPSLVQAAYVPWLLPILLAAIPILLWRDRFLVRGLGIVYVLIPILILHWLRLAYDRNLLLALCAITTSSDIMAYFAGRIAKSAPISIRIFGPNKSWAGIVGGVTAGLSVGGLFSLYSPAPFWASVVIGGAIAAISLSGDLFESYLKRQFGVKDSSSLIPGHGGLLDRFDGLIFASVFVFFGLLCVPDLAGILGL